jgi:hypothetical protein
MFSALPPKADLNSRFSSARRRNTRHRDRQCDSCRVTTQDHQEYQPPHGRFGIGTDHDREILDRSRRGIDARCFGSQSRALGLHLNQRCAGQPDGRNKCNGVAGGAGSLAERRNGFGRNRRGGNGWQRRGRVLAVIRSFRNAAERVEQQRPVSGRFNEQIFHRDSHLVQLSVDMMRAASRA